ncbi:NAD(P)-binding domain-containing protein [Fundicoccus culcitae]|uniref:NAD(P)-binding domain-containing protein n=1 Tax=Fundicoccus culcitae TaxID=2969821 RepID=A0ABY5P461_9LACT|nr:NAD(P)-binding domain-containing protein [Fundicoccus culcitae]UUX33536.1 NAD(P)-binding domain-containing protein [Fundicoccus culcitae]
MIGFIGLGIMGHPMAKRLVEAGFNVVVSDLDENKVEDLISIGAIRGNNRVIANKCELVILMLPSYESSIDVLFGDNGLISSENNIVKYICNMASISPGESIEISDMLKEVGIEYIDGPVSGGEAGATSGSLAIMVGGNEGVLQKFEKYLKHLSSSITLCGSIGAGSSVKLANQVIVNGTISIIAESFNMLEKSNIDVTIAYDAIKNGLASSKVLDRMIPFLVSREFKAGGTLSINYKDINNIIKTADNKLISVPHSVIVKDQMKTLINRGESQSDHTVLIKYYELINS